MLFKALLIAGVFGGLLISLLAGFKGNRSSDDSSGPSADVLHGGD